MALDKLDHPEATAVAIDFSPSMLEAAQKRFGGDSSVMVIPHNLESPLPEWGKFDAVVSSFALHHLTHDRKRALYAEIYCALNPGGVFCNLEHVSSPTQELHDEFLGRIGYTRETEDPSNKLLALRIQLGWLREIGFVDVDCSWKWRELALLAGRKPWDGIGWDENQRWQVRFMLSCAHPRLNFWFQDGRCWSNCGLKITQLWTTWRWSSRPG